MEVRTERPDRHIIILVGYNLLANSEQVVSSFSPLCTASENTALQAISDPELSRSISGMALRVGDLFLSLFVRICYACVIYLN